MTYKAFNSSKDVTQPCSSGCYATFLAAFTYLQALLCISIYSFLPLFQPGCSLPSMCACASRVWSASRALWSQQRAKDTYTMVHPSSASPASRHESSICCFALSMPATFGKSCDCSRLGTALNLDDMTAARALQYVVRCQCLPALPLYTICMMYLWVSMQHADRHHTCTTTSGPPTKARLCRKSTSGCHPANHKSGFYTQP